MKNYIIKSTIIKITVYIIIIILLFLILYISKNKQYNDENKVKQNATTIMYEVMNNIDNIDEYQKSVYEDST